MATPVIRLSILRRSIMLGDLIQHTGLLPHKVPYTSLWGSARKDIYRRNSHVWNKCLSQQPNICVQCRLMHLSFKWYKKRKTAEDKKPAAEVQSFSKAKDKEPVAVWRYMTVADVANAVGKSVDHVFEVMMYVDNSVYYDKPSSVIDNLQVIQDIVKKSGMRARTVPHPDLNVSESLNKDATKRPPPDPSVLVKRPPVVTIMGHVDHGKTTLLDSLRNTSVVKTEFGGITQHIGAFSVKLQSEKTITFLDTPGHAAFTAMRARGAKVTDLVVLVVAADDGVMEQTVESIRMAKAAEVPIIVAINKIDKKEADIECTKDMLIPHGIQVEDRGGDVQAIPISALAGTNLDELSEAIVLQAELMDLKGDPRGMVEGVVVESRTDSRRGKLATVIVQRGTLQKGAVLVAGLAWAKVRAMFNEWGQPIQQAPPSTPVEVLGWRELPSAGSEIIEVESEKRAREVMKWRESVRQAEKQEAEREAVACKIEEHLKIYKTQLEMRRKSGRYKLRPTGPRQKEIKDLDEGPRVSVVVKGDVDGSVEAILDILETYDGNAACKLDLVHYGVGNVSETDVELADTFNAIIYCFNVEVPDEVEELAKSNKVSIHSHNVIYKLVDDLKKEISSQLPLKNVEEVLGEANVLQDFEVTEGKKKVHVAGCRCTKGILKKTGKYRLHRGQEVIYDGLLASMRHLKNEVDSIKKDVECGVRLEDGTITFKPGDILVCYQTRKEEQQTDWDPGF
ncbi:translation initiation factor IF-2, mitochondrial isoform X2 [Cryptotermes secundus]|uniref:translation initiation factor IF-2, mitochondrial isoform X2 n=1 Tax=Cryptotermes secundus TaxID=105785 RepID=UPI000CD7B5D5|nr:translation initiation factor IF-2, mitochondrial isoform X2 [Cryptotermes secundus]